MFQHTMRSKITYSDILSFVSFVFWEIDQNKEFMIKQEQNMLRKISLMKMETMFSFHTDRYLLLYLA